MKVIYLSSIYLAVILRTCTASIQQFEFSKNVCSRYNSTTCYPPAAVCTKSIVRGDSRLHCAVSCSSTSACSGFLYKAETKSCILSIGYCRNSTYKLRSAYKAKDCSTFTKFTTRLSDGHYRLYPTLGQPKGYDFYCHLMNTTTPSTFLTLHIKNSMIYGGDAYRYNPETVYTNTTYYKIRLNLETLMVDVHDYTFTTNTSPTNKCPYASCGACKGRATPYGQVTVNLEGTKLHIDKAVKTIAFGYRDFMAGDPSMSDNRKILKMQCGGECGVCSTTYNGKQRTLKLSFD